MSIVTVQEAKEYLRVSHNADDSLLLRLIDEAESAARHFLSVDEFPRRAVTDCCPDECNTSEPEIVSDGVDLDPMIRRGILLHVQAGYDVTEPGQIEKLIDAAQRCWWPFRCGIGV